MSDAPGGATGSGASVHIALVVAIAVVSTLLYGRRLGVAPPHAEIDEVLIALDARSVAETGRDFNGRRFPLYFQTAEHSWYQPFVIYTTAAALEILPFNERSIRVPTVCIAVADVALMYLIAARSWGPAVGVIAAALLMLTPAHFIHARYAMDYLYPVPFVLGWLYLLGTYHARRRPALVCAATAVLGLGFYSYIASIVMMPLYFVLTCAVIALDGGTARHYRAAAAGFLPWLIPFGIWLLRHPDAFGQTVIKYGLYDPAHLSATQGLRSMVSYSTAADRLSQLWNYSNPSFLFFRGAGKVMFSTSRVGVFLVVVAPLILVGAWRTLRRWPPDSMALVVVVGFATAPAAALILAEPEAIFRALAVVPFGILLAAIGVGWLWADARLAGRIAVAVVAVVAVVQFRSFWTDYFGDYRERVAFWLGGNIGGAMEAIITRDAREPVPAIYFATLQSGAGQIDGRDQYIEAYWRFYLAKHRRGDLERKTHPLPPGSTAAVPHGSLVLTNSGNAMTDALVRRGDLRIAERIPELNHSDGFVILER